MNLQGFSDAFDTLIATYPPELPCKIESYVAAACLHRLPNRASKNSKSASTPYHSQRQSSVSSCNEATTSRGRQRKTALSVSKRASRFTSSRESRVKQIWKNSSPTSSATLTLFTLGEPLKPYQVFPLQWPSANPFKYTTVFEQLYTTGDSNQEKANAFMKISQ